jgi:hypothetical protein
MRLLLWRSFVFSALCARKSYDPYATSHTTADIVTTKSHDLYATSHTTGYNLIDGIKSLGDDAKLIAEGRVSLAEYYGTNQVLTLGDNNSNMSITLRLDWTSATDACPVNSKHPRDASMMWFFADESRCVCTEDYQNMGQTGTCEPYPQVGAILSDIVL